MVPIRDWAWCGWLKGAAAPALVLVLLNAFKPLHVDDAVNWRDVQQIARHPFDPYGFSLLYFGRSTPANHMLVPPVLLYWDAAGLALLGDHPFLWKIWLFPFALALAGGVWMLARRFAPGLEGPLVWMTVLSPAILPSLNQAMPDVPALALAVLAIALFLRSVDLGSLGGVAWAGVVAGLAMQTKYTGVLAPAGMVAYGWFQRRLAWGLLAVGLAAGLFMGWEGFVYARYGESHFVYHLVHHGGLSLPLKDLGWPLVVYVGALGAALLLLGTAALRASPRMVVLAGTAVILGYVLIAWGHSEILVKVPTLGEPGPPTWDRVVFGITGLLTVGVLIALAMETLTRLEDGWRDGLFLATWLALEIIGYFALSPFPAARRVQGVFVSGVLFAGFCAARAGVGSGLAAGIATWGALLGIFYFAVDLREALVEKEAAERAVDWVRARQPRATIWYIGYWGFEFAAERAGMRQVVRRGPLGPQPPAGARPIAPLEPTVLHRGDWVVVPHPESLGLPKPDPREPPALEVVERLRLGDDWPVTTMQCYYGGFSPLERHRGPRMVVRIARVLRDYVPVAAR